MKTSTKHLLYVGLLSTLGFSLSFNPESTKIAKHDSNAIQSFEFASSDDGTKTDPNLNSRIRINLGEYDNKYAGVEVVADLSQERAKANYSILGSRDICDECSGISTVTLNQKDFENFNFLRSELARVAIEQIRKGSDKKSDDNKKLSNSKTNRLESECDGELEDGILICHADELTALADGCDDLERKEKVACYTQVDRYFSKYLQRNLSTALGRHTSSAIYTEAKEVRDDLIAGLPSRFDNSIRAKLLQMSAGGVLQRTQQNYQMAIMTGAQPGFAATQAKMLMMNEMNFQNPYSVGGELRAALNNYINLGDIDNPQALSQMFLQSFYQPLQSFWMQDHKDGFKNGTIDTYIGTHMPTLNDNSGLITVPGLATPGRVMPDGLAGRRSGTATRIDGTGIQSSYGNHTGSTGVPALGAPSVVNRPNQPSAPIQRQPIRRQ